MTKKPLILATIAALVIIGLAVAAVEFFSYRSIDVVLDESVSSVAVHQKVDEDEDSGSDTSIITIESSGTIRLKEGQYLLTPNGDDITSTPIDLTVNGNKQSITVRPPYSNSKLSTMLSDEQPAIIQLYRDTYDQLQEEYVISEMQLFDRGQWAVIIMAPIDMDEQSPSGYYRSIAHKKEGQWQVMGVPRIALTTNNTSDVPRDILSAANRVGL